MKLKRLFVFQLLCTGFFPTAQAQDNQSSYDPLNKLLTMPVVKVVDRFWSAELLEQGGFQFQLSTAVAFSGIVPDVYPIFDLASGTLTIPNLSAFGKVWTVTLQTRGDLVFNLALATEVKPAPVTNPPATLAPKERYSINNDGTVTDKETGLQWMRCSLGQTWMGSTCAGNLKLVSMQDAAYAGFLATFAGQSDWRLPTVDELKTLVYCSSGNPVYWNTIGRGCEGDFQMPTLYKAAFPETPVGVYWTITNLQADPGEDYNLTVSFRYGHVYYSYFNDAYEYARFVRGQSTIIAGPEYVGGFKE